MIYVDIKKDYGAFKLEVKFKSDKGILGLLGESGSGKSLSLKSIAGIEKPDYGKIILNDRVLFDSEKNINLRTQDRRVGYLFQDYALFPNMTVLENINVGIREKISKDEKEKITQKILEDLEILNIKNSYPKEISGGEKQRVALGRILVNKPEILLLDEPFSALDDFLRWKIELNLKDLIRRYNLPSIFVSHSRDEIYRICDYISIIKDGKSEEKLETKDLFKNPRTFSAALISGCKNFSSIETIGQDLVYAKDWGINLKVKGLKNEDMVGIRSHHINLSEIEGENSFKLENYKEIDDLFEKVLIVETLKPQEKYGHLRISLPKDQWEELKKKVLYVNLREEKLMLLKSKG